MAAQSRWSAFDYRYSRWDGTQEINPFDADAIMDAISDDMLSDGDLTRALQRLFRWGAQQPDGTQMPGMRELMERIKRMRQQEMNRYDLGSILDDLNQKLDEVIETEQAGIEERLRQGRERLEAMQQRQQEQQQGQTGDQGQPGQQTGSESGSESGAQSGDESGA